MRAAGINSIRTYYSPPTWLLETAEEQNIGLLIDIPWSKHLCFLESAQARREAYQAVREATRRGRRYSSVLAYSIGNEIPANIVRWHGAARVERFLAELADAARQEDPDGLITYANYPPTEYLDLSFADFATFNVYLHDREAFRRYLLRLQNLVGGKPLVLGEIGMDTLRHGEAGQAAFLSGHLQEAFLLGLAGAFVFSWTDDWFTGGYQIEDWAFGITRADRSPKESYFALRGVFTCSPAEALAETPRVSVVVCSYNGARTLEQCLHSLSHLDYPDYEVILVDDGSTDNTAQIAARFPHVRYIYQENQGLSVARNTGLRAATGEVVAYTDSDCFADPAWLTHLVYPLQQSGAAAVGGPNLTPEDGWLAACVAASPGQPTHVLLNDQVAEHIPGCNMAFRRKALEAINGFNPQYRKAGDDVDVCWRLQQAGMWITFAPGAFVWHHRRQTPRTYLKQQAGYGEAEALLWFEHPDRFNGRGESKWQGTLYGGAEPGLQLGGPVIYRGTFGEGLFQTLYQPPAAHWTLLPGTLEWHVIALLLCMLWGIGSAASILAPAMLGLSFTVAALRAAQAPIDPKYKSIKSRLVVAGLCYLQPLVRSWWRYRTRLFPPLPTHEPKLQNAPLRLPLTGVRIMEFWDESWRDRTELLGSIVGYLTNHRWAARVDSGWNDWDLEIHCHPWTVLQVCTAQENHGSGKRLIRVRYRLRPSEYARAIAALGLAATALAFHGQTLFLAVIAALLAVLYACLWWRGRRLASQAMEAIQALASDMGLLRCDSPLRWKGSARSRSEARSGQFR